MGLIRCPLTFPGSLKHQNMDGSVICMCFSWRKLEGEGEIMAYWDGSVIVQVVERKLQLKARLQNPPPFKIGKQRWPTTFLVSFFNCLWSWHTTQRITVVPSLAKKIDKNTVTLIRYIIIICKWQVSRDSRRSPLSLSIPWERMKTSIEFLLVSVVCIYGK
jgi:hypothetical protein